MRRRPSLFGSAPLAPRPVAGRCWSARSSCPWSFWKKFSGNGADGATDPSSPRNVPEGHEVRLPGTARFLGAEAVARCRCRGGTRTETGRRTGGSTGRRRTRRAACVCYQASLMREEERPITFRGHPTGPRSFPPARDRPRACSPPPRRPETLRRARAETASPGAEFHRSLIAVEKAGEDGTNLRIWGSVHSGTRWIRRTQGGREVAPPLPPAPVVHVTGPGRLSVYRGDAYVAGLEEGRLREASTDVFASGWMPRSFAPFRAELDGLHRQAREHAIAEQDSVWAPLDPDLSRHVGQHAFRRIITVIRDSRHGGTISSCPRSLPIVLGRKRLVGLMYRFASEEPRGAPRPDTRHHEPPGRDPRQGR